MNDEKITPPDGMERALAAALADLGVKHDPRWDEAILYSAPMQEWFQSQRPTTGATAADEPRDPLQVVCTVRVDISSPHAAADALSRVPIDASVKYEQGQGIISGLLGVGSLIATWTEER